MNKNKPGIIWGQHRTSELIAIGVKDDSLKNSDIKKEIPFIESQFYRYEDL